MQRWCHPLYGVQSRGKKFSLYLSQWAIKTVLQNYMLFFECQVYDVHLAYNIQSYISYSVSLICKCNVISELLSWCVENLRSAHEIPLPFLKLCSDNDCIFSRDWSIEVDTVVHFRQLLTIFSGNRHIKYNATVHTDVTGTKVFNYSGIYFSGI